MCTIPQMHCLGVFKPGQCQCQIEGQRHNSKRTSGPLGLASVVMQCRPGPTPNQFLSWGAASDAGLVCFSAEDQGHDLTRAPSTGCWVPDICPFPATQAWSDVQLKARAMAELGQQRLNEEQRVAVASMLLGVAGARPFALNGPPGTGKTVTLVEMGLQVRPVPSLESSGVNVQHGPLSMGTTVLQRKVYLGTQARGQAVATLNVGLHMRHGHGWLGR